jgi:hypothetical protein
MRAQVRRSFISTLQYLASYASATVALLVIAPAAVAGTGTFRDDNGVKVLDFCVSIEFNATADQLQEIRETFERGSEILADATDGQLRFGRIAIFDGGQAGSEAEVKVFSGSGQAFATAGEYGVRGSSISTYYDSNYANSGPNGLEANSYTCAHEFMHHLYCLKDEYTGATCAEVGMNWCGFPVNCDASSQGECEPLPGSPTAEYCLLDDYYARGGNMNNPAKDDFTLNELCVSTNHDMDADTGQTCVNGNSCWELIANHPTRALVAPIGQPVSAPPSIPAPDFVTLDPTSRFIVCIDRSGSMSTPDAGFGETRLDRAKAAAEIFTNLTESGDSLGVTSFSCSTNKDFSVDTVDDGVKSDAIVAINLITAGGDTAIGRGLEVSRDMLIDEGQACNQPIVLITDGFQNCGPSEESMIDSLIENGIPVHVIAIGSDPQIDLLTNLAQQTGGKFYSVETAEDLTGLAPFIYAAAAGDDILSVAEGNLPAAQTILEQFQVEPGAEEVTFALSWTNPSVDYALSLIGPSGFYSEGSAAADPNIDFYEGAGHQILRIRGAAAVPGNWEAVAAPLSGGPTAYQIIAIASRSDVTLSASTNKPTYDPGEDIVVRATPRFEGKSLAPVLVDATVELPDGTILPLTLVDDGTVLSGDSAAGDGTYSARIPVAIEPGSYRFRVTASAAAAMTTPGEALFASIGDPYVPFLAPSFERRAEVTAVVGSFKCGFSSYGETVTSAHTLLIQGVGGDAIGTTTTIETSGTPSALAGTHLSLVRDNTPLLGGTFLVSPQKILKTRLFFNFSGFGRWPINLPNDTNLIGIPLYFQSFALDPLQSQGWSFSDGLRLVICPN